jgi:hypothetical protein
MDELLSNTGVLIILGNIVLVMIVSIVLLSLYARKAAKRKAELVERLDSLSQLYRSTLIMLTKKLAHQEPIPIEATSHEDAIANKLAETLAHLKSLGTEETEPKAGTDPAIQAAQVRYQILLTEQELIERDNGPELFWQSYTARAHKMISQLIPPPAEVEVVKEVEVEVAAPTQPDNSKTAQDVADLKSEVSELKRQIENLKGKLKSKEAYREEVLDIWEGKKNQILQHYDRLLKATRRADNRHELANLLSGLFNDCADLGETISGDRISHKGISGIDHDEGSATATGTVHQVDGSSDAGGVGKVILKQTAAGRSKEALRRKSPVANMAKVIEKDVVKLKTVVNKQRSLILKLRDRVKELENSKDNRAIKEYEQQVVQLEQLLDENDKNIQALEGELDQATEKITVLEDELYIALDTLAHYQAGEVDAIKQLTEDQLQALNKERERLTAKKAGES